MSCCCWCWWCLGTEHASNPALTTNGGDGGPSSFNDTTCRASGGKGGKRVQSNSVTVTTKAHGGEGGVGNRIIAGGGAAGGVAGTPSATGPGTPGTAGDDGTLFQNIGKGGGGGAGGVGKYRTELLVMRLQLEDEVHIILEIHRFMVQEILPVMIQIADHKMLYQEVQVEPKHLH